MKSGTIETHYFDVKRRSTGLVAVLWSAPRVLVPLFSLLFLSFALMYAVSAIIEFITPILHEGDFTGGLVKGVHMGVVALALYELAQVVHQEYDKSGKSFDAIRRIRRSVTRFASIVFVALVLESLIMVIKYSQQELAGFLYYPVAIIISAALLLMSLGVFIKLSGSDTLEHVSASTIDG